MKARGFRITKVKPSDSIGRCEMCKSNFVHVDGELVDKTPLATKLLSFYNNGRCLFSHHLCDSCLEDLGRTIVKYVDDEKAKEAERPIKAEVKRRAREGRTFNCVKCGEWFKEDEVEIFDTNPSTTRYICNTCSEEEGL